MGFFDTPDEGEQGLNFFKTEEDETPEAPIEKAETFSADQLKVPEKLRPEASPELVNKFQNLPSIPQRASEIQPNFAETIKFGKGFFRGMGQAPEIAKQIGNNAIIYGIDSATQVAEHVADTIGWFNDEYDPEAQKDYSFFGQQLLSEKDAAIKKSTEITESIFANRPTDLGAQGEIGYDLSTMALRTLGAVGLGAVHKNPYPALAAMYPDVFGQKFAELKTTIDPDTGEFYDDETARLHGNMSAFIEIGTETLPFSRLLKNVGWSGVRRILDFTVMEGAQEAVSGLLQGMWDKGTINPNLTFREIMVNAGYEGLLGTMGGPLVAGPVVLVDNMQTRRLRRQLENDVRKFESDLIRQTQGPQLSEVADEARQRMVEAEELLKTYAEEDVSPPIEPIMHRSVEWYDSVSERHDPETSHKLTEDLLIQNPLNQYLPETQEPVVKYAEYDWAQGQIAVAENTYYQNKIMEAYADYARAPENSPIKFAMAERVQYLENLHLAEMRVEQEMKAILEDWASKFIPGKNFVIGTTHISEQFGKFGKEHSLIESGNVGGHMTTLHDGTVLLEVNMEKMTDAQGNLREGMLVDVLAHEFGHAVLIEEFRKLPEHIQQAITKAWWKRMSQLEDGTISLEEYFKRRSPPFDGKFTSQKYAAFKDRAYTRYINDAKYTFGLNEFLANEMAKAVGGKTVLNDTVTKHFRNVGKTLKYLHDNFKAEYGSIESYDSFIDWLTARNEYYAATEEMHQQQEAEQERTVEELSKEHIIRVMKGINRGGPPGTGTQEFFPDDANVDLDIYNQGLRYTITLVQLAQINPHIKGLQDYTNLVRDWWSEKTVWEQRANERIGDWQDLGAERLQRFNKFMLELTVESFDQSKRFDPASETFQRLARKHQMDDDMVALYDMVSQDFLSALNAMEIAQTEYAQSEFRDNPGQLELELQRIQEEFNDLRNLNFFPLSRFGDRFMRIISLETQTIDGKQYKPGDTVSFETFESKKMLRRRLKEVKASKRVKAEVGKLSALEQQFAGIPSQFVRMLKERLKLEPGQQDALDKLLLDIHPAESFKKHMKHRKNVPGFSQDALRGYANYFQHFGNYLARIKYKWQLEDAMKEVRDSAEIARQRQVDASTRDDILTHLRRHNDYIMNPENELANLRALGFLWYLGFVPKSAVVNLTQVPLVTYPYLAAKYGDAQAVGALTVAMKKSADYWRKPQKLSPGEHNMVQQLIQSGILDESIATELAAVSEGSALQRLMPGAFLHSEKAARAIRTGAHAGAWMFQQAEKVNRRVTAFAAYDLAIKDGMAHEQAVVAARQAVERTQFEYARWNRPEFMRRKRSVFFLFWQYKQHALFFLANDPGRWRYMLMMLLMAGLSGLPFAEDIMDLYDYLVKKTNKWLGEEKLDTNVRLEARKFAQELGANPDLLMHGYGSEFLGLFDISGSLSMGRIIPGIEPTFGREGDFNDRMSRALQEAGGAVPAMGFNLLRAIADDNPNTLKRWEKALPAFARNPTKALRFAIQEKDVVAGEAPIARFDMSNPYQMTEILGQAAGFPPTRVMREKEKYYMTQEMLQYYELRKRRLLQLLDYSIEGKDKKLEQQVWKDISKYNKSVPFFFLKLTGENIKQSRRNRVRKRNMIEQGFFTPFKGQQLQSDVDEGFVEEEVLK